VRAASAAEPWQALRTHYPRAHGLTHREHGTVGGDPLEDSAELERVRFVTKKAVRWSATICGRA